MQEGSVVTCLGSVEPFRGRDGSALGRETLTNWTPNDAFPSRVSRRRLRDDYRTTNDCVTKREQTSLVMCDSLMTASRVCPAETSEYPNDSCETMRRQHHMSSVLYCLHARWSHIVTFRYKSSPQNVQLPNGCPRMVSQSRDVRTRRSRGSIQDAEDRGGDVVKVYGL